MSYYSNFIHKLIFWTFLDLLQQDVDLYCEHGGEEDEE
jgi:hypothetical protein